MVAVERPDRPKRKPHTELTRIKALPSEVVAIFVAKTSTGTPPPRSRPTSLSFRKSKWPQPSPWAGVVFFEFVCNAGQPGAVGNSPITSMLGYPLTAERALLVPEEQSILDSVFEKYGKLSGLSLSSLTHRAGTPWDHCHGHRGRGHGGTVRTR